jgi:hypothetical protein
MPAPRWIATTVLLAALAAPGPETDRWVLASYPDDRRGAQTPGPYPFLFNALWWSVMR